MSNYDEIKKILTKLLVHETVDGLLFCGPKLLLSTDTNQYDEVFLSIEGTFMLTDQDHVIAMNPRDTNKLQHLCTLAYQKISSVQIVAENNLRLYFQSGLLLDILGENDTFESWQVEGRVDGETTMIVAGPGKRLTLFK